MDGLIKTYFCNNLYFVVKLLMEWIHYNVLQQGGGGIEEQPDENVTTEWFEALRADNVEKIKELLKTGKIDINCKDQVSSVPFFISQNPGC